MEISARNVGRIAERIAMNELEARDFHIIDLAYMSKTSANVDFIASKAGHSFNVQVKGMSWVGKERARVQYGHCDDAMIERRSSVFNRHSNFALMADVIVLLAVRSPSKYRAVIMPVDAAEQAAQLNMDGYHRQEKVAGGKRKPSKLWTDLEGATTPRTVNTFKDAERAHLQLFENMWETLGGIIIPIAAKNPDNSTHI
ncbi:MAG: hypothetical protein KAY22_09320 [Rhizorhabdus sp.]|uniref:hypothetical protein n=1 Tax=Rhizorhabdus sp. TaxID=1968843 RepID=UPI001B73C94B|nr:hypothetical protein [Rhizorhabdus sp.]MBP8232493.1 hypothetical protein [Rhizorhabdus sp.]